MLYFPDGSTRDILLTKERTTIGRRPDNDVPLPSAAVSAEHAAVVTVLDDSFLEDLGSTNGTFVNEKPVTKHFLRDRDRLDVGREIMVYYADDGAHPRRAAGRSVPAAHRQRAGAARCPSGGARRPDQKPRAQDRQRATTRRGRWSRSSTPSRSGR